MRVATWNINNVTKRLDLLLEWLERTKPDVVALQELKATTAAFPADKLKAAGYESLVVGQSSWNGVALLARGHEPLPVVTSLPGDLKDKEARYVEAAINGVLFGCLYLPNGNPQPGPKFDYKLKWMDRLNEHARKLYASRQPVIIAGDYNVVPTDFDIYNPRSWLKDALLQPESRERYQKLLDQGWIDAIRHKYPKERIYTFWDYFRQHWQKNAGLRIDHLLLSDELKPRLVDAGVDRWVRDLEKPSDHAPTWVTLKR